MRTVTDSVHGSITLDAREWAVVDTASFQRLRHLKQLQMSHLTYPNATHTRFAHSLGVFAVMSRVVKAIERSNIPIDDERKQDLRLAALLHDVGHYPYSHLMEAIDAVQLTEEFIGGGTVSLTGNYPNHEDVGAEVVTNRKDLVKAIGGKKRAQRIAALFTGAGTGEDLKWSKLIHSSLDMDRFDFLLRDAMATGVPYGNVDLPYLLDNVRVSDDGVIGFSAKAITAAEQFLFARYFMYKVVYYHKTTFGLEEACRQLLRRCRDAGLFGVPKDGNAIWSIVANDDFLQFTDAMVDNVVRLAAYSKPTDPAIQPLANAILNRRPPKLLGEATELRAFQDTSLSRSSAFLKTAKREIKRLAGTLGIPPGLFLIVTKKVKLEDEPNPTKTPELLETLVDRAFGADNVPKATKEKLLEGLRDQEHREDLVRIFVNESPTPPTPLVKIPWSITHVAAKHFYEFARIYLVADDAKVAKAKQEVQSWLS